MASDTKLVYFQIVDATQEEVSAFGDALAKLKGKFPFDIEFLIGNDRINLYDVKFMINELYKLYRKEKKLIEKKKELNEDKNEK